jgi:hypothetical protein
VTASGLFDAAVHPVCPAAVHSVMTMAALPDAGMPLVVPPDQLKSPEAVALSYVAPAGIS